MEESHYNVAVYMFNGRLYHSPPGEKVWVYMDDMQRYFFGGVQVPVFHNNPAWNRRLQKTHSMRPWPGPIPHDDRRYSELNRLLISKF